MSPGSLAFCLQLQFSFQGAVALWATHISREEESREWGCRACPARVPVRLGTPGPPTLIGTGGCPQRRTCYPGRCRSQAPGARPSQNPSWPEEQLSPSARRRGHTGGLCAPSGSASTPPGRPYCLSLISELWRPEETNYQDRQGPGEL